MFCNNCGNQLEEGTMFCQNCGTAVNPEGEVQTENQEPQQEWQAPQQEWQAPQQENPVDKVRNLLQQNKGIVGIVGVVAVVVILICLLAGGGGYKKAINGYMKAFKACNVKKIVNLTVPKDIQKDYFDEEYDMTKKEYIEETKEDLEDEMEDFKDDDGKIKWEIKKAENIDKLKKLEDEVEDDWGIGDLDDFRERLEDRYDDYDFDADKVSKAYAVEVKFTVEMDDEKERNTGIVMVYKYKGSWYVYGMPF